MKDLRRKRIEARKGRIEFWKNFALFGVMVVSGCLLVYFLLSEGGKESLNYMDEVSWDKVLIIIWVLAILLLGVKVFNKVK